MVEGAARRDADYFRRRDTAGSVPIFNERKFERRWVVLRAAYEVATIGRPRARMHNRILFVYSPNLSHVCSGRQEPSAFAMDPFPRPSRWSRRPAAR
jgi:hypothetical protein